MRDFKWGDNDNLKGREGRMGSKNVQIDCRRPKEGRKTLLRVEG